MKATLRALAFLLIFTLPLRISSAGEYGEPSGPICQRTDLDSDASGKWFSQFVHGLCKQNRPEALATLFVLTTVAYPEPDLAFRGADMPKAAPALLWTAAVLDDQSGTSPAPCPKRLAWAERLTKAAPNNAMSWVSLAYVNDSRCGTPERAVEALRKAKAAPTFHDFSFDLEQQLIRVLRSEKISQDALDRSSGPGSTKDQLILSLVSSSNIYVVGGNMATYLFEKCSYEPDGESCEIGKSLLKRGDSGALLSGSPADQAQLTKEAAKALNPNSSSVSAQAATAFLDEYIQSSSQRDLYSRVGKPTTDSQK